MAFTPLERVLRVVSIRRSERLTRSFVSRPPPRLLNLLEKHQYYTLRPYRSLRFARPRCRADLRGHHDDLHGSNVVFKACRSLFNLEPRLFLSESANVEPNGVNDSRFRDRASNSRFSTRSRSPFFSPISPSSAIDLRSRARRRKLCNANVQRNEFFLPSDVYSG